MRKLAMTIVWATLVLVVSAATWAVGIEAWADTWGATAAEASKPLAGDDLIEGPVSVTTRAVTVDVPAEQVWPWVAQFGQGRGGLYSYDWLENLFGSGIHSTDEILPAFQDVEAGDRIWITQPGHPAGLGHVVAIADAPRALVTFQSPPDEPVAAEDSPWTWSFVVETAGEGRARLISRNRYAPEGPVVDAVMDRIVGPIGFAMERRTLLGIAERAESAAGLPTPPRWREPLWFGALLVTGAGLVWLFTTRTSAIFKALAGTGITVAATLVLFRFPSAGAAVGLAVVTLVIMAGLRHAAGAPVVGSPGRGSPQGAPPALAAQ